MSKLSPIEANNEDKTCVNPIEDQRKAALKHYEEASAAIHHWSSFVQRAIETYNPLATEALAYKKEDDEVEFLKSLSAKIGKNGFGNDPNKQADCFLTISDRILKLQHSYKAGEDLEPEKEAEVKGATGCFIVNNGYQIHVKHGLITKIENIDE